MATSRTFLDYLLDQLSGMDGIRIRPMMGEYLLYYQDRLVGDICDNCLFVKPVAAALALLPDAQLLAPYPGAKPMLAVENLEDREGLRSLLEAMYPQLPPPKAKKKRERKP